MSTTASRLPEAEMNTSAYLFRVCFISGVSLSFKMLFLEEANRYRRMHSGVPLMWSVELTMKAQKWAEYIAGTGK